MALIKAVEKPSGIIFNYHRITSLQIFTNIQNTIEVGSYISKEKRELEKNDPLQSAYVEATFYVIPYDQDMTIDSAYDWLKQQPEWKDAIND